MKNYDRRITFVLAGMTFEYDEAKNKANIEKHGISFRTAARVFFDYDRIEYYDEENSQEEDRYDVIGDLSAGGKLSDDSDTVIGAVENEDVLFVVYTERIAYDKDNPEEFVTRLISARYATSFERGLYYGKYK